MPGLLTLLIVALAAAALTAVVSGLVVLRRERRLGLRHGVAGAGLLTLTGAAACLGVAALLPGPVVAVAPVAPVADAQTPVVAVVDPPLDVQLPTLALEP